MQRNSVSLVQRNTAALIAEGRASPLADEFLDQLLRRRPELAPCITADTGRARRHLVELFHTLVRQASNPQALAARLAELANANEERGIGRDHYEAGRDVLIALLRQHNDEPSLLLAWEELLDHVMIHLSPPASFGEAMAA
jgi:hemoglobin-like flavoprotein